MFNERIVPVSTTAAAALARARALIAEARRVTVLTGAGVSAASGIPTFRGPDGLWRSFKPEDLATARAFARDPKLVWDWYDWRRQRIGQCVPNAAHDVLAGWTRTRSGVNVITQNVDGLHERAGTTALLRLHGSIWHLRCWEDCTDDAAAWLDNRTPLPTLPPRCPRCGALARPAVVWFGEPLDPAVMAQAERAATACDVFLSIGTASVVYPAAGLLHLAKVNGARLVEINPEETGHSSLADVAIRMPAADALVRLA